MQDLQQRTDLAFPPLTVADRYLFPVDQDCTATPIALIRCIPNILSGFKSYTIPRDCVTWTLSFNNWISSAPVPLPSKPAHCPTSLVSQSIPDVRAHLSATSTFSILSFPWKFWHITYDHHILSGLYFATHSCCTFPPHSIDPCLHVTPQVGSDSFNL